MKKAIIITSIVVLVIALGVGAWLILRQPEEKQSTKKIDTTVQSSKKKKSKKQDTSTSQSSNDQSTDQSLGDESSSSDTQPESQTSVKTDVDRAEGFVQPNKITDYVPDEYAQRYTQYMKIENYEFDRNYVNKNSYYDPAKHDDTHKEAIINTTSEVMQLVDRFYAKKAEVQDAVSPALTMTQSEIDSYFVDNRRPTWMMTGVHISHAVDPNLVRVSKEEDDKIAFDMILTTGDKQTAYFTGIYQPSTGKFVDPTWRYLTDGLIELDKLNVSTPNTQGVQ